jgi:predicted aldo/keto reductase-like oxidoreductase
LASKTRQIRAQDLEQWIIELGGNSKYEAPIQAPMKKKDKEIQVLKQKLKILGIDHVQIPELHAIQVEKYQLVKKMVDMGE